MIERSGLLFFIVFMLFVDNMNAQIINEVVFEGNKRTQSSLLNRITEVKAGQMLDTLAIERDIQILNRLSSISNTKFEIKEDPSTNNYQLTYILVENFTLIPNLNFYATNEQELAYRAGLAEFNFLGENIAIGGFYQKDIFSSFQLGLRAPFILSKNLGVYGMYQDMTTLEPVFFEQATVDYKYNNRGFEIGLIHQYNVKNRIDIGVKFFKEKYESNADEEIQNIPINIQAVKQEYKLTYLYDDVSIDFYFLDGLKNTFNIHYIQSDDDLLQSFYIWWNDLIYYKKTGNRGNFANRFRVGFSENIDSPFAPFSVDNNLNIRGVGNTIDRGTASLVFNTEYRYTILEKGWFVLQGNAFIDMGAWRKPGKDITELFKLNETRFYPGLGIRVIHKKIFNAILRIDYGHGIGSGESRGIVFGIGQYF